MGYEFKMQSYVKVSGQPVHYLTVSIATSMQGMCAGSVW